MKTYYYADLNEVREFQLNEQDVANPASDSMRLFHREWPSTLYVKKNKLHENKETALHEALDYSKSVLTKTALAFYDARRVVDMLEREISNIERGNR